MAYSGIFALGVAMCLLAVTFNPINTVTKQGATVTAAPTTTPTTRMPIRTTTTVKPSSTTKKLITTTKASTTTSAPVTCNTCLGNATLNESCPAYIGSEWPCCQAGLTCVAATFTGWRYACVDPNSPQMIGFNGECGAEGPATVATTVAPPKTCLGAAVLNDSCPGYEGSGFPCCRSDLVCVAATFTSWRYACMDPNNPLLIGFTGPYGA